MVSRSQPHGLVYLADAAPHTMFATNYGDKVAEPLLKECGHSQVLLEQYLDFVVNRTFRQSLLVHAERAPQVRYSLDRSRYQRLHFAAHVPPVDDEVLLDGSVQEFGIVGQTLSTQVSDVKVALDVLTNRWPWTLSRRELVDAVGARMSAAGIETAVNETAIDDLLEYLIVRGQVRIRLDPVVPEPTSTPPRLDEPARRLAELVRRDAGQPSTTLGTNRSRFRRRTATCCRCWTELATGTSWGNASDRHPRRLGPVRARRSTVVLGG